MRIGLVLAAYQAMDYLENCLLPWILLRKELDIKIVCVHCCFMENHENGEPIFSTDGTTKLFEEYLERGYLDGYCCSERPLFEHEARNIAVEKLLLEKSDYIWTIGVDEFYTQEEVKRILSYIERNPLTTWFGVNYKNYVFNRSTWVDGFCPPRIFKVETPGFRLNKFYWDDDIQYIEKATPNNISSYKHFSNIQIPRTIAHVDHYTWLSDERSKKKVAYQEKHFGPPRGAGCSFRWNEAENKLEFNTDFYKKTGQTIPELNYENNVFTD